MANISKELSEALESDCAYDLEHVIQGRKQEDFEALQSLLSVDPSINPGHRAKALYALGRWGNPAPVTSICAILPLLSEMELISAIDALGRLGTQKALACILDFVSDSSPRVRKFVTHALGRINTPVAQAKLKEIASKETVEHIRVLAAKYSRSN